MKLNTDELEKEWEANFYESSWTVDTLNLTDDEKELIVEMESFLPRHMPVYDWSLPFAEAIIMIIRRQAFKSNNKGRNPAQK